MTDLDKILQDRLQALEKGKPIESVLNDLPQEAQDLAPLIRLASAVRTLEHPEPHQQASQPQHVLSAERGQNHYGSRLNLGILARPRLVLASGLAGVLLVVFFLLAAAGGLGLWLAGPSSARAATLMDVNGQVQIASQNSSSDWQTAANGEKVHEGERIRTGSDSSATLLFYDGSRSTMLANTDVTITTLQGDWQRDIQVKLTQQKGKTSHSVVPLHGDKSSFLIQTPSGLASVRGTTFNVSVDQNGLSRFAVGMGKVLVSNQNSEMYLGAGQAALLQPGQALDTPSYQFTLQGPVDSIGSDSWMVASVPFSVTQQTNIAGDPQIGDNVIVEGRILEDQSRIADSITPTEADQTITSFTGNVDQISTESWQVDGVTVLVDSNTQIDEGIQEGDPVRVTFTAQEDGSWLALKIESLQEETPPPPAGTEIVITEPVTTTETVTATVTVTPSVTVTPTLTVTPSPSETMTSTLAVSSTLVTDCTGVNPHPKAVALANEYGVTPEEIMGWFCQRFGFGEIDLAYGLSKQTGVSVDEIFAMRSSGLGWGQIKKQLKNVTPTPTPEPGGSSAPAETPQPPTGSSPVPPGSGGSACSGSKHLKQADAIAKRYGASYEEIIGWYCQGYNFGNINHAYGLSQKYSASVSEIFNMLSSGMNWGQIEQQLSGGNPGNSNPPHKKKP